MRQRADRGGDLGQPGRDVVQAAGEDPHLVTVAVHLDPDAVQLVVHQRRQPGLADRRCRDRGRWRRASAARRRPTCRPTASSAGQPAVAAGPRRPRWSRTAASRPGGPPRPARRRRRPARPAPAASIAPCRSSPNTSPRSKPCSSSVARANSARTAPARASAEPGAAQPGHLRRTPRRPRPRSASARAAGGGGSAASASPPRSAAGAGCRTGRLTTISTSSRRRLAEHLGDQVTLGVAATGSRPAPSGLGQPAQQHGVILPRRLTTDRRCARRPAVERSAGPGDRRRQPRQGEHRGQLERDGRSLLQVASVGAQRGDLHRRPRRR